MDSGAIDQMNEERMADVPATIATYTVDRLAYSLSPPVVAAVIDFDGGGRFQCELTDVDPASVKIGDRVEMTFRRLYTGGRHPQLLLEGPAPPGHRMSTTASSREVRRPWHRTASATRSPSSAWAARPSASTGTSRPTTCSSTPPRRRSQSAGVALDDVDAFWLGTMGSGLSGLTLSRPLKIDYKPVTRVENFCATGSEAFRNACYAVASGAYDVAMAIGVEKLKDSGFSGLVGSAPGRRRHESARHRAGQLLASSPRPTPTSTASTRPR